MIALVAPCRRLPLNLSRLSYAVPPALAAQLQPGQLVRIPLRSSSTTGLILSISVAASPPTPTLKSLISLVNPLPALSCEQVHFLHEVSTLYHTPLGGLAVATLFPLQKKALIEFASLSLLPQDNLPRKNSPSALQRSFYYETEKARGTFFEEILTDSVGQTLVLAPTIQEATHLFSILHKESARIRLVTSEISAAKLKTLWIELWQGKPLIIIGTRRAIFLPWNRLARVIVDAEADPAYHSFESAPRAHARDLAERLAMSHGAQFTLSGHTPSAYGYEKQQKNSQKNFLPVLKQAHLINVDIGKLRQQGEASLVSPFLVDRLRAKSQEVTFLFLNQRGNAQCIMCKDCRYTFRCPTCQQHLTFHAPTSALACHICGFTESLVSCPQCQSLAFKRYGYGTGALENYIKTLFPDRACVRIDGDQTELPKSFKQPGLIIIGTERAWHLVPWAHLGLLALIDNESPLRIPAWHISEDVWYRLRSAVYRLPATAELIVQSDRPAEESLTSFLSHPQNWYEQELSTRQALSYPPYATLIKMWASAPERLALEQEVRRVHAQLSELTKTFSDCILHDPAPLAPFWLHQAYRSGCILKIKRPFPAATERILAYVSQLPQTWKVAINPDHLLS